MDQLQLDFGWRTALLGLIAVQITALAIALVTASTRRMANRLLAGALLVIAGLLIPYAIGFAGAYDLWRGLTFAPFAIPLALGPLLYAYAHALEAGRLPRRMAWHMALPLAQFLYFGACFLLPLDAKWAWYTGAHREVAAPVLDVLAMASLGAYAWAIGRVLTDYRRRLADARSDDDLFSARWLGRVRAAIVLGLLVEVGFWLWSALTGGIDYFQQAGLYFALGALGLYLGVSGWRHAGLPETFVPEDAPVTDEPVRVAPDWGAIAADFAARTRAEGWWREPALTLPRLARCLGTNSGRLSRAINLGLGVNFSVFVNGLRAEGVAEALAARTDADLLDLAFEMGFASKASFNRAFQARYGLPPSRYRQQVSDPVFVSCDDDLRRAKA